MMRLFAILLSWLARVPGVQEALDEALAKQMGEAVSLTLAEQASAEAYRAKLLKELRRWPNVMST